MGEEQEQGVGRRRGKVRRRCVASSVEPEPAGWVKMLTGSPTEINHYGAVDRQEFQVRRPVGAPAGPDTVEGLWALLSSSDAASSRDIQH